MAEYSMCDFGEEILMSTRAPRSSKFYNESLSHVMKFLKRSKKSWPIVRDSMIEWGLKPECDFKTSFLLRGLNNINLKPRASRPYYLAINGMFVGFRRGKNGERIYYKKEDFTPMWVYDAFFEVAKLINKGVLSRDDIYRREVREIDERFLLTYVKEEPIIKKKRIREENNQSLSNSQTLKIGLDNYDLWASRIGHLDMHKCGKAFKCNGCGLDFGINKGWRIDLTDYCFCNNCMKQIKERLGPRFKSRISGGPIIYTPMGNKR